MSSWTYSDETLPDDIAEQLANGMDGIEIGGLVSGVVDSPPAKGKGKEVATFKKVPGGDFE